MINRVLTPLAVAVMLGLVTTISLFFVAAAKATGPGETAIALGPLRFVRIVRTQLEVGSEVTVTPGLGLLLVWLALLIYGGIVGWRRYRAAAGASTN